VLAGGPGLPASYLEPLELMAGVGRQVIFYDQVGSKVATLSYSACLGAAPHLEPLELMAGVGRRVIEDDQVGSNVVFLLYLACPEHHSLSTVLDARSSSMTRCIQTLLRCHI
jgi:hypothetical protein